MRRPNTKGRRSRREFSTVHPDAAGIDVGSRFHVVAVAADRNPEPVRTFSSFTHELHRLADWLAVFDQRIFGRIESRISLSYFHWSENVQYKFAVGIFHILIDRRACIRVLISFGKKLAGGITSSTGDFTRVDSLFI